MLEGEAPELKLTQEEIVKVKRLKYKMCQQNVDPSEQGVDGKSNYPYEDKFPETDEWKEVMTPEEDDDLDFESIDVLKNYKLKVFEKIIRHSVDRKYKISFYKGVQMVLETLVLLILMISVCMKANMFSIIYVLFICKYLLSPAKTQLMVHATFIISFCFISQYFLYLLNLANNTSPALYPRQFKGYPYNALLNKTDIKFAFPMFFKNKVFHDLKLCYFIGIGVDATQINNLILDFLNLFLVSMYILNFRNPVLVKSVEKIFWQFPMMSDNVE